MDFWKSAHLASDAPSAANSMDLIWTTRLIAAAIAGCILLQIHLAFVQPINWDEFRFLADIHTYQRGELSSSLLTFQVHPFGWLTGVGSEIDQVRLGRLSMLALETGTLFLIWAISGKFFKPLGALFAALGYISFSFVLQHGASFRFDPIVTFLLMSSITLLLRERLSWLTMAAVGLALALATMVSVKVALALPLVVAVGAYRLVQGPQRREAFLRLMFGAAASVLFLTLLYTWHLGTLAKASGIGAQGHLASSYAKTIAETSLLPGRQWLLRALLENPLHWVVLLFGVWAAVTSYRRGRARALVILAFLLPLLSISVYRNAFPYFYAFILAPASVLFAAATDVRAVRKYIPFVVLVWAGGAIVHHQEALSRDAEEQQQVVKQIHTLFPKPVPYLDRCSMVGSFPQAGVFLSSWWLENYAAAGRPIMRDLVGRAQPVFVIANSPQLKEALDGHSEKGLGLRFFQEDRDVLAANYIHYSGPIWVAGKQLPISDTAIETEFLVGGEYALEGHGPIKFDDRSYSPGDKLIAAAGVHRIASATGPQQIVLRWAAVPRTAKPEAPSELHFGRF